MADKPEVEIIDVVEEVLDNQTALAFLVGGAIVGGIIVLGWLEYQKNVAGTVRVPKPTAPRYDPGDDRPEEVPAVFGVPSLAQGLGD